MQGRTSYGMFIPRFQDEVVARVEQRVSSWLDVPVVHQEDIQVCSRSALTWAGTQCPADHMSAEASQLYEWNNFPASATQPALRGATFCA